MVLPRHKLRGLSFVNVALVAIVLAIAVTAYFLFFKKDPPAASATQPSVAVQRGDVTASVSSSGTLQSSQTASPQFETSGTVTQVLVKVGQVVAKGAAIAKIDPAAAERQLRIAQQNQIASANSVTAAEETLSDAQDALEAAEEASASPSPTPTPGNGQQQQTQQTQQSQGQGQSQSPEVAVSNAEASLAKAKADKEQSDQNVEAAQAAVDATTLKAPIAGTVTAVNGTVGSVAGGSSSSSSSGSGSGGQGSTSGQGSASNSGTSTTSGTGFVDIADLKALQVVAAFAEADAIKIKAGQAATVTLNAEPGTTLTASLATVSPTPTTTNGVVSYSATFSLAKLPANARMGQTANVTVQTAKAANALYVPSTAIATSGTTYTVTMADGSGTREVQVGVRGDSYTQITSGLNEGDRIELLQGAIGGTGTQNGQGRQGQLPGGGQFPGAGVGQGTGAGGFRGR
ncbi:macrolide-specific efflux system membrane fusion protein [Kribbella sp. VKM Ac-2571]|uniref:efflux RND transporter periplasmic adaptor subunit n=1 Tax=Kribbella sp. VKM Ac-2571 TaxID=2512222 RepID=UPI00105BAA36|nr:HlyD family efflux transporter periplasmic adaptor subunit [Kribbella sp. VKM Ac-2571]TDO52009.1 macrolide-specific efflux system membrane fusion protein [Kribbella sp. VKM Ac-2571]